jgi:hypothetical protein
MDTLTHLGWPLLAAAAAAVLSLAAGIFVVVRASKTFSMRDGVFFAVTLLTAAVWTWGFLPRIAAAKPTSSLTVAETAPGAGACVEIRTGMRTADVAHVLGEPETRTSEEDIWGPGAVRWSYTGSRCRVHLLDGVVHMVD